MTDLDRRWRDGVDWRWLWFPQLPPCLVPCVGYVPVPKTICCWAASPCNGPPSVPGTIPRSCIFRIKVAIALTTSEILHSPYWFLKSCTRLYENPLVKLSEFVWEYYLFLAGSTSDFESHNGVWVRLEGVESFEMVIIKNLIGIC